MNAKLTWISKYLHLFVTLASRSFSVCAQYWRDRRGTALRTQTGSRLSGHGRARSGDPQYCLTRCQLHPFAQTLHVKSWGGVTNYEAITFQVNLIKPSQMYYCFA